MRIFKKSIFNDWVLEGLKDYSHRLEVYYGGAGSGKSHGAFQKILLKALNEKRRVLVIRKVQSTLKHSVWSMMIKLISEVGYYEYCRINMTNFEIELPNGSLFLFKGLDDVERVKSIDGIDDIVIEECTELVENDFTQLNLRLRSMKANNQIYLMFNPISKKNWVYKYFFNGNAPKNAKMIQTTYQDNKFLPEDYKIELENLKDRNPAFYKIYALGEFATLDKLIFPIYQTRIVSKDEVSGLKKIVGLDFGYTNDPSAIIEGYYDEKNRRIYVTGEYVRKGMLNDEIAEVMIQLGLAKDKSYADSAEPKSIAEIKQKGINIEATVKGKDSVMQGIQWIQQNELIVDERCTKTLEELDNYTWKRDKKTQEYINEPTDTYNHCIDALRYALTKYIKGQLNPTIRTKASIFGAVERDDDFNNYWRK